MIELSACVVLTEVTELQMTQNFHTFYSQIIKTLNLTIFNA